MGRQDAFHIGWLNPETGALHRQKMDLHPGPKWEKVYVLRDPPPDQLPRRWVRPDEVITIAPQVTRYLEERAAMGVARYGRPLNTHNERDPLVDAFEELADLLNYLAQELIQNRGGLPPGGGIYASTGRTFDATPRPHPDRTWPPPRQRPELGGPSS